MKGFSASYSKWVKQLTNKHEGRNVFDLARTESGVNVSDEALTEYLRESVRNIIYQDHKYTSPIREPSQIAQLYFDHYWAEMSGRDKIDLALILLMDGNCGLKDHIVPRWQRNLSLVLSGQEEVSDELGLLLLNLINQYGPDYAKVRMETIFDRTVDGKEKEAGD